MLLVKLKSHIYMTDLNLREMIKKIIFLSLMLCGVIAFAESPTVTKEAPWKISTPSESLIGIASKHLSEFNLNPENFNFEYILLWAEESIWTNQTDAIDTFLLNLYTNNSVISSIETSWTNALPFVSIALTGRKVYDYAISKGIIPIEVDLE